MLMHITHTAPNNALNYRALVFLVISLFPGYKTKKLALGLTFFYLVFEFVVFTTFVAKRLAQFLGISVLRSKKSVYDLARK
jgi:hypothetical protein